VKALTPVRRPAGGLSNAVVGKPAIPGSTLASRQGSHARDSGRPAVTPVTPAAAPAEAARGGEETVTPRQLVVDPVSGGSVSFLPNPIYPSIVVDLDPHHFGNLDPHPHQIKIRIRIRSSIKVISWIRIRIILQMKSRNVRNMSLFEHCFRRF
jgi:hypothetical protein